jgi:LmbE family N-acetylglucosaminyl deacetylase
MLHIYLSPHLDDAVLSCGGMIHRQTQAGEGVLVVTICAGDPPPGSLSPFAQSLHERWRTPLNATAIRRTEDLAALAVLGAEARHLSVPDSIYRTAPDGSYPYASEQAIFGEVHPAESNLLKTLAQQIRSLEPGRLYVPYGLGHHVDHQLTRQAAEQSGLELVYYEDYPYAEREAVTAGSLEPEVFILGEADLAAKARAIAAYTSQLSSFWPDEQRMDAALRAFARRVGKGVWAERLWRAA